MIMRILLLIAIIISLASCSLGLPPPSILTTQTDIYFNNIKIDNISDIESDLLLIIQGNKKLNVVSCYNGDYDLYVSVLKFVGELGVKNMYLWSSYEGEECNTNES